MRHPLFPKLCGCWWKLWPLHFNLKKYCIVFAFFSYLKLRENFVPFKEMAYIFIMDIENPVTVDFSFALVFKKFRTKISTWLTDCLKEMSRKLLFQIPLSIIPLPGPPWSSVLYIFSNSHIASICTSILLCAFQNPLWSDEDNQIIK